MTAIDHDATEPNVTPDKPERKVSRALGLSLLNTAIGRVGTVITGIVLAHILVPADFGAFAVALVALNALLSINELGVSLALVRWPGNPRDIAPTVTTISIASSAVLFVICWFAAPEFALQLGSPGATGVVRLLCSSVLIDGATAAAAQFVNREFRQGTRLVVDFSNLALSTGITVVMALLGCGAWSLAVGRLVGNGLTAVLLFRLIDLWPRPGFDRKQARELLRFGLPLAGASLLVVGMLNVDYVVTGHILGAVALGLYLQAFNLASWPVNMFSTVVRRVSLAAFARVQDDRVRREAALARLAALLMAATLPVCALLGLLALPIVTTLYGPVWADATGALEFLVILGAVRVATELGYDFLVALGYSRRTMWLQAGWFAALVVCLPVGAHLDGIRGVGEAHAAVALFLVLPAFVLAVRATGVPVIVLGRAVLRPVLGCALLVAVVLTVRWNTSPGLVRLVLGGVLGMAVYVPVVWPLRRLLRELG
ncbi:MAG TPA: lipopolysaccharide biosynthesis protein [Pseudonocardiaceae bacterium]|jgi:PST family polysaccharide transporter|nr:lipopolysaccharide biosynthesis protein [Pseudonocardiaceae bacterium]